MAAEKDVDQETGRDQPSEKNDSNESSLSKQSLDLLREPAPNKDVSPLGGAATGGALGGLEIYDNDKPVVEDSAKSVAKKEAAHEKSSAQEKTGAPEKPHAAEKPDASEKPGVPEKPADSEKPGANPEGKYRSDVDGFRDRLIKAGVDPDKVSVRVAVRELDASDPRAAEMADMHARMVECSMKDPEMGLSRGMDVKVLRDKSSDLTDMPDSPAQIAEVIRKEAREVLDSFTKTLKAQFLDPNNKEPLRVINASNGGTPADFAGMVFERMKEDPESFTSTLTKLLGKEKAGQWIKEQNERLSSQEPEGEPDGREQQTSGDTREASKGSCPDIRQPLPEGAELVPNKPDPISANGRELLQKLVDMAEKSIASDPKFKESLARYQQVTKEVADRGGIIVISAANSGEFEKETGAKLSPGSQYNFLAMSDHVITVGSSDAKGTPGDHSDDQIAGHSSVGTERFSPTVVAQGIDVPSRQMPDGKAAGTSIAAPIVANGIALMLTQNPDLTFNQVKRLLQENSLSIPGVSGLQQGAGILQIDKAVLAARASRK
jgi:hypothetical protein